MRVVSLTPLQPPSRQALTFSRMPGTHGAVAHPRVQQTGLIGILLALARHALPKSPRRPSCPALCRASTSSLQTEQGVDGRDKPGHDGMLHYATFAFTVLVVSLPRMSITFTTIV